MPAQATQVQLRRGTNGQHNSFTGANGEVTVNTTNDSLHVHDGSTVGGFELARNDFDNVDLGNISVGTATTTINIPNLTGDITSSNTVTSIAPNVIVNADINTSAAIALSKLATTGIITATTVNATTLQIGGVSVTSTAAELNKLDGVTSTAAELNLVDGSVAGDIVNSKAVIYGAAGQVNASSINVSGVSTFAGNGTFTGNGAIKIPDGGFGSRPGGYEGTNNSGIATVSGMIRFNIVNDSFEGYTGTKWGTFLSDTKKMSNIKDYGAVGDGSADDSDAIQDALNDSTVSVIKFPAGTYKVTRTLVFNPTTTRYTTKFVGMDGFTSQSKILFTNMNNNTNYPKINGNGTGLTAGSGGISMTGCTAPGKVGIWLGFKFRAENMGFESDTDNLSGPEKEELCTLRFERTYLGSGIDGDNDEADMDSSLSRCNFDGGNGTNDGIDGAATVSYVGRNMLIDGCSFTSNNTNIALKFPDVASSVGNPASSDANAYQGTPFGHRKNEVINCVFHLAANSRCIATYGDHTCHGLLIANNIIDIGGQLLLATGSGGLNGAVISGNSCFNGDKGNTNNLRAWIQVGVSSGNPGSSNTRFVNSSITGNVFAGTKYNSDQFFGAGTPLAGFTTDVRRYPHCLEFNAGAKVRNVTITGNSFSFPIDQHIIFKNNDTINGLATCITRRVSITGNTFTRRDDSNSKAILFNDSQTTAVVIGNSINAEAAASTNSLFTTPNGLVGLGTVIHQNLNLIIDEDDGDL